VRLVGSGGNLSRLVRRVAPVAFAGLETNGHGPGAPRSDWPTPPAPGSGIAAQLEAARAARVAPLVQTREQAIRNSVVNRSRDIVCGVLSSLPITVIRDRVGAAAEVDPGWLAAPDSEHSRGWFVSWVTDDLFFFGKAAARVTVRDETDRPVAVQWMPFEQLEAETDGGLIWRRGWYPDPFMAQTGLPDVELDRRDVILWESSLLGVLNGGGVALTTAAQLDQSANRFAGAELAAGWLKQTGGEPTSPADAVTLADTWAIARLTNAIGFLNETLDYRESEMDPSRLQLVEGRSYQDAQTARICNMPNWSVGVALAGDGLTYKTALTARLDLLDFGLQPFVECWSQTLSSDRVTPHGTTVAFDLEPFLRTATLRPVAAAESLASSSSSST